MDLSRVQAIMRWAVTAGYALLSIQQILRRNYVRVPMFCLYVALMTVDFAWAPHTTSAKLFIEPWIASLRFCCVLEAIRLCMDRTDAERAERKWIVLFMLAVGILGASVLHGYLFGPTLDAVYRSVRQHFYVALALASVMGGLAYALEGLRVTTAAEKHYLLLTGYLAMIAGFGFVNPGPGQWTFYYEAHIWYFAATGVFIVAWLRIGSLFTF